MTARLARPVPTLERILSLLSYDRDTGIFRWIKRQPFQRDKVGEIAGTPSSRTVIGRSHLRVMIDGRYMMLHRIAWLYETGNWPEKLIDHIDGNPQNNAFINLREASHSQNCQNRPARGYSFRATHRLPYIVRITVAGRGFHIGSFATEAEAIFARKHATFVHFGEFSVHARRAR